MSFRVGDTVIHSSYGLAEIVKMETKVISGVRTQCYVVRTKDLTIWIPVDRAENGSLRRPSSRSEFKRLFTILRAKYHPFPENRTERRSQIHSRMKEGTSGSLCRLVRDLSYYNHNKKLSETEGTIFERATTWLMDEWQYVMSIPQAQAKKELNHLLDESYRASTSK